MKGVLCLHNQWNSVEKTARGLSKWRKQLHFNIIGQTSCSNTHNYMMLWDIERTEPKATDPKLHKHMDIPRSYDPDPMTLSCCYKGLCLPSFKQFSNSNVCVK